MSDNNINTENNQFSDNGDKITFKCMLEYLNFLISIVAIRIRRNRITKAQLNEKKELQKEIQKDLSETVKTYNSLSKETVDKFSISYQTKFVSIEKKIPYRIIVKTENTMVAIFGSYQTKKWSRLLDDLNEYYKVVEKTPDINQSSFLRGLSIQLNKLTSLDEKEIILGARAYQYILHFFHYYRPTYPFTHPVLILYFFINRKEIVDKFINIEDYRLTFLDTIRQELDQFKIKNKERKRPTFTGFLRYLLNLNEEKYPDLGVTFNKANPLSYMVLFNKILMQRRFQNLLYTHFLLNINHIGLKYFFLEYNSSISTIQGIPDYLAESIPLRNGLKILIVMTPTSKADLIKASRIHALRISKSVASIIFQEGLSFDITKQPGIAPAIERIFYFTKVKNKLKTIDDIESFYKNTFPTWYETSSIINPKGLDPFDDTESFVIEMKRRFKTIDNEFLTDFPMHTPLIRNHFLLFMYIKLITSSEPNITDPYRDPKDILDPLLIPLRNFIQIWSGRCLIWESKQVIIANIRLYDHYKHFINKIQAYIEKEKLKCIFSYNIIDTTSNEQLRERVARNNFIPDKKCFNLETREYIIPIPTIKQIKKDLS
ncbi:MAG: hypothetical protein ACFFD1_09700 [Candidatus Thorarchaeota archaeon]